MTAGTGETATNDPGRRYWGGPTRGLPISSIRRGGFEAVVAQVFPSREHKGLEEIVAKFRAAHEPAVEQAAFGVAGPVRGCICATPNLAWLVDGQRLAQDLGLDAVHLLNDLEANAHGIAALDPSDFVVLNEGAPDAAGNAVLISPGTGLGEAGLIWHEGRYRPFPSEGGHADFAPRDDVQVELLRYLCRNSSMSATSACFQARGCTTSISFYATPAGARNPPGLPMRCAPRTLPL